MLTDKSLPNVTDGHGQPPPSYSIHIRRIQYDRIREPPVRPDAVPWARRGQGTVPWTRAADPGRRGAGRDRSPPPRAPRAPPTARLVRYPASPRREPTHGSATDGHVSDRMVAPLLVAEPAGPARAARPLGRATRALGRRPGPMTPGWTVGYTNTTSRVHGRVGSGEQLRSGHESFM